MLGFNMLFKVTNVKMEHNENVANGIREPADTLIEAYALEWGKCGEKRDIDNLIVVIYELFFAGTETTSTTLAWLVTCLANNTHVQDRMFAEIESVVGTGELQSAHFKDLPYTLAVQHEVQRYGCITPITISHTMKEDVTMSNGKVVRKGEFVFGVLYSIMRNPKYWKYPEEFNPENFLDDNGGFQMNEAFVPYGMGPRICLGQSLADLELKVFMIEIMRKFIIISDQSIDLNKSVQGITCAPLSYKFRFQLR